MADKKPTHVVKRAQYLRVHGKLQEVKVGQTFTFSKEQAAKLNPLFWDEYREAVAPNVDASGEPPNAGASGEPPKVPAPPAPGGKK